MERDFLFDSDTFATKDGLYCAQMRVTIKVFTDTCSTPKGTQKLYGYDIVSIYDEDNNVERKLSDFPNKEQDKILKQAEHLSDLYNYEAYEKEHYPF